MLFAPHGMIGRFLHRRAVARWRAMTGAVEKAALGDLDQQLQMAQRLQRRTQDFTAAALEKLALPRPGATAFVRPAGTDWSWRPKPWRVPFAKAGIAPALPKDSLTNELVIYHDCKTREISLRQFRNTRATDLAPYGVALGIFHFDGSYLSLVIEVPPESCKGLKKTHLIRLSCVIARERPAKIYARLNVKHGPNTEQVLMTLPDDHAETMVEFDLAYSQLNEARAERMWVDLIVENPAMNQITFHDFTMARYPRAAL